MDKETSVLLASGRNRRILSYRGRGSPGTARLFSEAGGRQLKKPFPQRKEK